MDFDTARRLFGVRFEERPDVPLYHPDVRCFEMLGADGALPSRQEGLRKLKTVNSDRQQVLEDRVAATEQRLRRQYQTLDANMARLNSLQNYVGQQITNWNKA